MYTDRDIDPLCEKEGGLKNSIHGGKWECTNKENHFYDR